MAIRAKDHGFYVRRDGSPGRLTSEPLAEFGSKAGEQTVKRNAPSLVDTRMGLRGEARSVVLDWFATYEVSKGLHRESS